MIVLSGRPHLRTPDGWRQLDESGSGREGMRMNFRMDGGLDYWDGECPPEVPG